MRKKGVIYKKMLFSFLGMLIIPLVIILFFYIYTYKTIESQTKVSNYNLLQTIQTTCDREIQYYQDMLLQISKSDTIKKIVADDVKLTGDSYYQRYLLKKELAECFAISNRKNSYCEGFFVYFGTLDIVMTEQGSFKNLDYINMFSTGEESDVERLKEDLVDGAFQNEYVVKQKNKKGYLILLTASVKERTLQYSGATVGVWLNMNVINDRVNSVTWENGIDWVIIDEENNYIRKPKNFSENRGDVLQIENGNGTAKISEQEYIAIGLNSDVTDWKYYLLIPESVTQGTVNSIRNVFVICIIFSMIIGYQLIVKIIRINYAPISELMGIFQNKNEEYENVVYDEHRYLKENTIALFEKQSAMSKEMQRNTTILKDYYLEDLMLSGINNTSATSGSWKELNEKMNQRWNVVLLLSNDVSDVNGNDGSLIHQKWREIVTESIKCSGIEQELDVETTILDSRLAIIIMFEEEKGEINSIISERIEILQKIIYEKMKIVTRVAAGGVHKGIAGIHQSYLESYEAESFLSILDQEYICYNNIKDRTIRKYDYSFEMEERIVAALRANNAKMSNSLIGKVLDDNFYSKRTSPKLLDCLVFDIFGTILKVGEEKEKNIAEKLNLKDMSGRCRIEEIRNRFAEMVEMVCENTVQMSEEDQNAKRCKKIREYIENNYYDPNLNVSQIGEYFHMTPPYLSSLYRKKTGESLVTVINETRIKYAVSYLKQGYSIYEVAEKCGFTDSSTFIKVFKKHTGVTPGHVKKIN